VTATTGPAPTPTRTLAPDAAIPLPAYDPYGYIPGGDLTHRDRILYRFDPIGGDVTIAYEAFDIDDSGEVRVYINDILMGTVAATAPSAWAARQITLPDVYVSNSYTNYLLFDNMRNPPSWDNWGIRNIRLQNGPTPSATSQPTPSPTSTDTVVAVKTPTHTPTFSATSTAVPTPTYTPQSSYTPTPSVQPTQTPQPTSSTTPGVIPTATQTGTPDPDAAIEMPAMGAYGYIPGGDLSHPDILRYRFDAMRGDAIIAFDTFDIDDSDEVCIYVNDVFVGTLAPTGDDTWKPRQRKLPDVYVSNTAWNYLRFDNTRNPPSLDRWGIRDMRLINPPTSAAGQAAVAVDRARQWVPLPSYTK
jgi:hypothetical protein